MSRNVLAIAGCKHTTKDLIVGLMRLGFTVDVVITIDPETAAKQQVAGYYDLRDFLKSMSIKTYLAESYSLKSKKDQEEIPTLEIGVLLCMGWQRLIPEWMLEKLKVGAFGMHGSNKPLPHGRGRSPLNWSLIQNKSIFFTHLFKYKPGVDDGDIVGYQLFEITSFDDAHTLHFKNLISMIKLCEKELPGILNGHFQTTPQKDVEPSFYPKRGEEDGTIFWEDSTLDIYNLIRAVTAPFPGAISYINVNEEVRKIKIWKAIPFDSHLRWDFLNAGQIAEILYDGSLIVKTGDTSLLVSSYEGITADELRINQSFHTNHTPRKVWENLPR
jgi:methionyl-tRNA formyltransferase